MANVEARQYVPLDGWGNVVAATVGATLSGVTFPLRHAGLGPYISSGGNVYYFGIGSTVGTNNGNATPAKASAPMTSFTNQTAKTMSSAAGTVIEAMACYQVGQVIHVAAQISTGQVFYNSYTMDTDSWSLTTSETAVAAASFAPTSGTTFVSLVVRSGGEVVIAYCAGLTAMSSGFNMVRGTRRTGTNTYSALSANIDNGGSVNWRGAVALLGASDRVHFFFSDVTNLDAYQRTLTAANALQTFPASFDATTPGEMFAEGTSYVSGATTKVRAPYRGLVAGSHNPQNVASLDSSDAPTASTGTASDGTTAVKSANNQPIAALAADGTTLHALWADNATSHLTHDTNSDGAGWGTDVDELTATINRITPNVYTRSGTKYLAMVVDDGGTIKYAEITLTATDVYYTSADLIPY